MIPATDILIAGDTAWTLFYGVIGENGTRDYDALDRPCGTCQGRGFVGGQTWQANDIEWPCPDCIDGRYTFDIEVERDCDDCDDGMAYGPEWEDWDRRMLMPCETCGGPPRTLRVSVVAVYLIVDVDGQPEGVACVDTLGNVWCPDIDREGEPVHYLKGHVALPDSAAPGKWAVQLRVAT